MAFYHEALAWGFDQLEERSSAGGESCGPPEPEAWASSRPYFCSALELWARHLS